MNSVLTAFRLQDQGAAHMRLHRLMKLAAWLRSLEDGQDLLEYAFLAALIAIVAIAGVDSVGRVITNKFWDAIALGI